MTNRRLEAVPGEPSEWVAGIASLPSYVTEGNETFRPEVLLWVDVPTGYVVGVDIARPGEGLAKAADKLRLAAAKRVPGAPVGAPARVRVASAELANALRGAIDGVKIVITPTPELDDVVAALAAHLEASPPVDETYFVGGAKPAQLATFFAVAARLYRARPWDAVPADECLSIDCDALGITNGRLCVVGQMGQSYGFAVYPTEAAFQAAIDAGSSDVLPPTIPPQIMFSWDDRGDIGDARAKEVKTHRWELAGPRAYPSALRVDDDGIPRPLVASELAAVTAIVATAADLVERTPKLQCAWHDGTPFEHRASEVVEDTAIAVTLVAPSRLTTRIERAPREPALASVLGGTLVGDDGERAEARCEAHVTAMSAAFARSPEAGMRDLRWAEMFVELAANHHGKTVPELSPTLMRDILFGLFPRKVQAEPQDAPAIVASVRALLAFVARELGGDAPNRCLASLAADASQLLARELADPANFGPAKALLVEGAAAGYDMTSEPGIAAWVHVVNERAQAVTSRAKPPTSRRNTPAKRKSQRTPRKQSRR
jgi:hypothetical protein